MKNLLVLTLITASSLSAAAQEINSGHAPVNGIKMYYEIYGTGRPLVLIHGGGSTIQTTFGRVIPLFAKHRRVIALELQAHGRTGDRDTDLTFEQDADDVAALLRHLQIDRADFFGFSNGGTTTLQIAIRHPQIVNKIILGSTLASRSGMPDQFWDFMRNASLSNMPTELQEAYLEVAGNPAGLQIMHDKDAKRMVNFRDIPDAQLRSIKAPSLIINGDKDIIKIDHALKLHQLLAASRLAIIPGGHGEYIEEITTLSSKSRQSAPVVHLIEGFLSEER